MPRVFNPRNIIPTSFPGSLLFPPFLPPGKIRDPVNEVDIMRRVEFNTEVSES